MENRARFARNVLRTVRDAAGPTTAVTAKLNMADGVDGGLWLDESVEVATLFEADGALDALGAHGGQLAGQPHVPLPGRRPLSEFGATLPPAVRLGFRVVGHRFLKSYPYEEAFFLPYHAAVQGGPVHPAHPPRRHHRAGDDRVGTGGGLRVRRHGPRPAREPDLPNRMQAGTSSTSLCIHCNKCMPTIYSGTRCVLVDDRPGSA